MKFTNLGTLYSRIFVFYCLLTLLIIAFGTTYIYNSYINNPSEYNIKTNIVSTKPFKSAPGLLDIEVQNGDTLMSILLESRVKQTEAVKIIASLARFHNPKKLSIGQKINLTFDLNDIENNEDELKIQSLTIKTDYTKEIKIERTKTDNFIAKEITIPLKKKIVRISGAIDNSLISTATEIGLPQSAILDIVKSYSYDVDFQRDIQPGNELDVFLVKYFNEKGEFSHDGNIIYSSLKLDDRKIDIYYYTDKNGDNNYYTSEGRSVKKELLRTPLNIVKISSKFGMRKHPVLGYTKMHKGIDFSAPIGTPILAAGHGIIEEIGRKGAYGNYVRIRHNNGLSTAYAHASRFNTSLRKGSHVKQGEVVAYVGSTGRATGPHLHFEVLSGNQQIDPLKIKVSPGAKLSGKELLKFNAYKAKIDKLLLNTTHLTELALEETGIHKVINID